MIIEDAVHRSLRAFCPCPECDGLGFIEVVTMQSPRYMIGNGPVRETELCSECHGSGTTAWETEPVPQSYET